MSNGSVDDRVAEAEALGPEWSAVYDFFDSADPEEVVGELARRVRRTAALELGVGTGRIALPLAERGVEVHGLDASAAMLAALRAKDRAGRIVPVHADMTDIPCREGAFGLVYAVNNSLSHLLSPARQMACLASAARVLAPGGQLVIEGFLPAVEQRDLAGSSVLYLSDAELRVRYAHVDAARQMIRMQVVRTRDDKVTMFPMLLRYIWPAELDLMVAAAGLKPISRHGGWRDEPFEGAGRIHVSTYLKH